MLKAERLELLPLFRAIDRLPMSVARLEQAKNEGRLSDEQVAMILDRIPADYRETA